MHVRQFALLLSVALVGCESTAAPSASNVVRQFYAATIAGKVSGAPTAEQLTTLTPLLSDTLRSLLAAARRLSDAEAARSPDEKPPFVEGDLFSSLFEGPTSVEVSADSARGDRRVASVRMTSNGANPPVTWVDRAVLVKQGDRYVIDDIEYGGQWDFANKGTVRSTLVSGLAAAK
jgi:hypothetical protein